MPNWVTNEIVFENKADAEKVVAACVVKAENGQERFDFEKLVPMPDDIYRGDLGTAERELYGHKNWYDWSIENWGTKWNASDYVDATDANTIYFDTAWSAPHPIMEALAEKFPEIPWTWRYADEDFGYNTGIVIHEKDEPELDEEYPDGGSYEAFVIARDLRDPEEEWAYWDENAGKIGWREDEDWDDEDE